VNAEAEKPSGSEKPVEEKKRRSRLAWMHSRLFSPKGFVLRAMGVAVIYLVLHVLGWRASMSIVCGTSPTGDMADTFALSKGCAYGMFYFLFHMAVPVLFIAAGIFAVLLKFGRPSVRVED